jgi:segregation and condensation protein B
MNPEFIQLKSNLESLLFVSNKPLSAKQLAKLTNAEESQIKQALTELILERRDSGVVILEANNNYQMATNGQNSEIVKAFLNSDLREKLTDATVEVLAIIAYRQPISKSEIEAIRGVNSQYSIRHLLMRGLIEKVPNPNDSRSNYYQITTEFMQQLGITRIEDLPEFNKLVEHIKLPEAPGLTDAPPIEAAEQATPLQEISEQPQDTQEQ